MFVYFKSAVQLKNAASSGISDNPKAPNQSVYAACERPSHF